MNHVLRQQLAESRRTIIQVEATLRGATRHLASTRNLLDSPPRRGVTDEEARIERDYLLREVDRIEQYIDELDTTLDDHRSRVARLEQQERLGGGFSK